MSIENEKEVNRIYIDKIISEHELRAENARLRAALERISDPTPPSIDRPSFRDWELRQMAREALRGEG